MHKFCQRRGEMAVLLVELVLGLDHDTHVTEREVFGVGAGGIVCRLGLVGRGRSLSDTGRSLGEQSENGERETSDDGEKTIRTVLHAESSPRVAQPELARQILLRDGPSISFFMLLP